MKRLTSKAWWEAALIRALRTLCQTAAACIGTAALLSEVDWLACVSAALLAALLSLLTSLGGLPEAEEEAGAPSAEKIGASFTAVHAVIESGAGEAEDPGEARP